MEQLGEGLQLREEEAWLQLVGNDGSRIKRSFGKGYRKSTTKIQRRACLVSAFLIFSVSYIQLPYIIFFNFVSLFCYKKTRPRALGMSNPMMDLVRGRRHERRGIRGRVSPWRRKRLEVENAWTGKIFDLQRRSKGDGKGRQHVESTEEKMNKERREMSNLF